MPARRPRRAAPLLLLLLAAAPLPAQQRWTLTPELRIGSVDDPKTALSPVTDIAVGEDGQLYVSQPQQKQIRIYSAEGDLLRIIGGAGGGPGEFRDVTRLFLRADTLLVLDAPPQRFTTFTSSGDLIRTFRAVPPGSDGRHVAAGLFPDGSLFARPRSVAPRTPLLRIDPGGYPDTLAWVSINRAAIRIDLGGRCRFSSWHTIPAGDLVEVDTRASSVTIVAQPPASAPDSAFFHVRRLAPDGSARFDGRFGYTPRLVSDEDRAQASDVIRNAVARFREPTCQRARLERFLAGELDLPAHHVPVSSLVVGRDGTTWLRVREGEAEDRWLVLDERGELIARVAVPASVEIRNADREQVWGVELDELDVPYVVRYRVEAGASSAGGRR